MISIPVFFWIIVILFAVIGAMRGWAKEIMVTFSVVLGIFLITVLENYVPPIKNIFAKTQPSSLYWMRAIIIMVLAFFGYQTPRMKAINQSKIAREHLQDILLGFLVGAFNGYLIFGTLWWFMDATGYPFADVIAKPVGEVATRTVAMMKWMPPAYLDPPWIYFGVGVSFLFVIIVFL